MAVYQIRLKDKLFDEDGNELPEASGENSNSFYKNNSIKNPLVSKKTKAKAYEFSDYNVYEIETKKEKPIALIKENK